MKIDTLGDFNDVIEYYKCMIDLAEKMRPNIRLQYTMTPETMATHNYFLAQLRTRINNIGVSIAQNFEEINEENGKCKVKEEDIRKAFEGKDYFDNLLKENNMSPYEVIKHIRNCLVHGEYDIELENVSDIELIDDDVAFQVKDIEELNIVLNNGKIKGKICALEIKELEYIYSNLNTLYSNRTETFIFTGNRKFASCKNKYFLKQYLDSIKKLIIRGKIGNENKDNIDDVISEIAKELMLSENETKQMKKILENIKKHSGANYFQIFEEDIENLKQNKKFVEEYIKYIGLANYQYLVEKENPYILQMFKEDVISATFEGRVVTDINNTFCDVINAMLNNKIKEQKTQLDIKRMSYEGPIVYANMILGLANYVCVFLKETNNNEKQKGISIFEYHNLNGMNGIKPIIDSNEEPSIVRGIEGKNKLEKIQNTLLDYENQIKICNKEIKAREKKIKKLNDNNPKKNELKEKYETEIREYERKERELEEKTKRLQTRKMEYEGNYDDYTNFFRHLRNSIAHGTYEIDYIEALQKKDMRKIKYTFEDYKLEDKEKKMPEFKLEINAERLMRIIESVQNRVNKQTELEKNSSLSNADLEDSLKRMYISRKRDSQEIGKATYDVSAEKCDEAQKFVIDKLQEKTKGEVIHDE